jgi:hypothetical protein
MRQVYNDGGRKAAGYKGDAGRLRRSGWRESRKSPQWACLGAGGLVRSLPPPEMFA